MTRPLNVIPRHQARWWLWLCVVSVLGFQLLGLVHHTLHGGVDAVRLHATAQAHEAVAAPSFGHAAGGMDCQLLDQLSDALGPTVQALAWTALLPDGPVALAQPHSAVVAPVWRQPARAPPLA